MEETGLVERESKEVETIDANDTRAYAILVEIVRGTETEAHKDTLTIYADTPMNTFILLTKVRDIYNQPDVLKVKLVGVYKRIQLSVVEGDNK